MQHTAEHAYYNDIAIPAQNVKDPIVTRRHSHIQLQLELTFA